MTCRQIWTALRHSPMSQDLSTENGMVISLFVVKCHRDDWQQLFKKWKLRKWSSKKMELEAKKMELRRKLVLFFIGETQLCGYLELYLSSLWWRQYGGTVSRENCIFAFSKAQFSYSFQWQRTSKMLFFFQLLLLILV